MRERHDRSEVQYKNIEYTITIVLQKFKYLLL